MIRLWMSDFSLDYHLLFFFFSAWSIAKMASIRAVCGVAKEKYLYLCGLLFVVICLVLAILIFSLLPPKTDIRMVTCFLLDTDFSFYVLLLYPTFITLLELPKKKKKLRTNKLSCNSSPDHQQTASRPPQALYAIITPNLLVVLVKSQVTYMTPFPSPSPHCHHLRHPNCLPLFAYLGVTFE